MSQPQREAPDGAQSKVAGDKVESRVIQVADALVHVPDRENPHVDAATVQVLAPDTRAPFTYAGICLVDAGTGAEIKSTMLEIGSGRRGRFQIRRRQHRHLLQNAGVYIFALCRPTYSREVVAVRVVPATLVDELNWSWRDAGPDRETYAQITWSQIWRPDELDTSETIA